MRWRCSRQVVGKTGTGEVLIQRYQRMALCMLEYLLNCGSAAKKVTVLVEICALMYFVFVLNKSSYFPEEVLSTVLKGTCLPPFQ